MTWHARRTSTLVSGELGQPSLNRTDTCCQEFAVSVPKIIHFPMFFCCEKGRELELITRNVCFSFPVPLIIWFWVSSLWSHFLADGIMIIGCHWRLIQMMLSLGELKKGCVEQVILHFAAPSWGCRWSRPSYSRSSNDNDIVWCPPTVDSQWQRSFSRIRPSIEASLKSWRSWRCGERWKTRYRNPKSLIFAHPFISKSQANPASPIDSICLEPWMPCFWFSGSLPLPSHLQ